MKKIVFLFASLLVLAQAVFAQTDLGSYDIGRRSRVKGDTIPSLVTAAHQENGFFLAVSKAEQAKLLATSPDFFVHRGHNNSFDGTFDSLAAWFYVEYLNHDNASQYEYRVLQDDRTTLVPWSNITHFVSDPKLLDNNGKEMAVLGSYKADFGSYIVVDLRKKGSDPMLSSSLIVWRMSQPVLFNIYTINELNEFLKQLSAPELHRTVATSDFKKWKERYPPGEIDTATSLPKKLVLPQDNNSLIFYLKHDDNKYRRLQYRLIRDGSIYTDWQKNEFYSNFIWLKSLPPGEYRLDMRYPMQPQRVTSYPFLIKPGWYQSTVFKVVAGSLIAAFFGFIILLLRANRQQHVLLAEQHKKQHLETEIKAIRSQLNPHFVFNALSSIQGLVNNAEIDKANNYLSDFANLMRDVLDGNNSENSELYREIQTLESYLKLEQLRFHFKYNIAIGQTINLSEIQVPSLLLQPLVENAVKHGIPALKDKGRIEIAFSQNNDDMLIRVADNGKGFDLHKAAQGYGLKLTRQRIALVNEMSKMHSIVMDIDTHAGTSITLTFKNWLG